MRQLPLFGESRIERAFWKFHEAYPGVYFSLRIYAREWRARHPRRPAGIAALYERVRWELALSIEGKSPRLNNNFRAYYARLLMEREPDLAGLFSLRRQRFQASIGPDGTLVPAAEHVV